MTPLPTAPQKEFSMGYPTFPGVIKSTENQQSNAYVALCCYCHFRRPFSHEEASRQQATWKINVEQAPLQKEIETENVKC